MDRTWPAWSIRHVAIVLALVVAILAALHVGAPVDLLSTAFALYLLSLLLP